MTNHEFDALDRRIDDLEARLQASLLDQLVNGNKSLGDELHEIRHGVTRKSYSGGFA